MKIISPSFEILNISHPEPEKFIEQIARVCYKSEDRITDGSAQKLIKTLIKNEHFAMLEHVSVTFKFICDRGISHELVRHRVASYAQESTRYVRYDGEMAFIKPLFWDEDTSEYETWRASCNLAELAYSQLLKGGATPQEARSVLPNSLKTEIIITMNLRELRHFLELRTAKAAHPQMRELTIPFAERLNLIMPVFFKDIVEGLKDAN